MTFNPIMVMNFLLYSLSVIIISWSIDVIYELNYISYKTRQILLTLLFVLSILFMFLISYLMRGN